MYRTTTRRLRCTAGDLSPPAGLAVLFVSLGAASLGAASLGAASLGAATLGAASLAAAS